MQHREFQRPEELKETIKCFWYNTRDAGEEQSSFEVQPDGYAEIIFYFGSVFSPSYKEGLQPLPSPFLMGLLNQPAVFHANKRLDIIGVRCFPWTVFELLEIKPGKDSMRIFEHPIAQLQSTLDNFIQVGKIEEAIAQVTQYFLNARPQTATDITLAKAGVAMSTAKGTLPVKGVAAAAHATVRTLERKFKQSSGYTVKDVSGIMRFEQVRNCLWIDPDSNLAGLSQELGYTDQAHLSREFKRYSGTTPAAFARKAKKGKQVFGNDFVAFVQA